MDQAAHRNLQAASGQVRTVSPSFFERNLPCTYSRENLPQKSLAVTHHFWQIKLCDGVDVWVSADVS